MDSRTQDDADKYSQESLIRVQDAFSVVETIAGNVFNRAKEIRDAYLIGGVEELIGAIGSLKNAVSIRIARNGIEIEDAKKKQGEEKKGSD